MENTRLFRCGQAPQGVFSSSEHPRGYMVIPSTRHFSTLLKKFFILLSLIFFIFHFLLLFKFYLLIYFIYTLSLFLIFLLILFLLLPPINLLILFYNINFIIFSIIFKISCFINTFITFYNPSFKSLTNRHKKTASSFTTTSSQRTNTNLIET